MSMYYCTGKDCQEQSWNPFTDGICDHCWKVQQRKPLSWSGFCDKLFIFYVFCMIAWMFSYLPSFLNAMIISGSFLWGLDKMEKNK